MVLAVIFNIFNGSIVDPLLFNIYICDLFFRIGDLDIASYVDDNTSYTFSLALDVALKKLSRSYTIKIFEQFHNNPLKSNAAECNLITSSTSLVEFQIKNTVISSVNRFKLLGVHIDGRLDSDYHVGQICKKAEKNLHALSKVSKYMDINKRRMFLKVFIILQFSRCPIKELWGQCTRTALSLVLITVCKRQISKRSSKKSPLPGKSFR